MRSPKLFTLIGLILGSLAALGVSAEPRPDAFRGKIGETLADSQPAWPEPAKAPRDAPNVVVILLDDVGFGAADVFGGPVHTPELGRLATNGLRYNNFRTTAFCSPSRAALLTGRNDHQVGFGDIAESAQGFPGYNTIWPKDAVPLPEVLRRNGYMTSAFGKWHNTPTWETTAAGPFDRWPTGLGFDYFYGFIGPGADHWRPKLVRNTLRVDPPRTPEQGYNLTTDLTDDAIRWLHQREALGSDKPYFLYFAPGATHGPHQASDEWQAKYRGRFDQGYDKVRAEIFERQKRSGIIPAGAQLTPRPKEIPAWDSFSRDERKVMAHGMEVYAAFLAHTDYEVGRLLRVVQQAKDGENTLIIYVASDNGASAEGGLTGKDGPDAPAAVRLQRLKDVGTPRQPVISSDYAAGWAYAMSSPFQWFKRVASHYGGTTAGTVVSWPRGIKQPGGVRSQFTHVNAVAATVYEVSGVAFPESVDGVVQKPLAGPSFAYSFNQPEAASMHLTQVFEQIGNRAIYHDGWLAGARHSGGWGTPPNHDFSKDRWELYHVAKDYSQALNLADRHPKRLKQLQAMFDAEARKNDIYPLMPGAGSPKMGEAVSDEFTIYPDVRELPTPDFSRPHRITAEVKIPEAGASGTLAASRRSGGSGFVLYIQDDRLVYESFSAKQVQRFVSSEHVPRGASSLVFELAGDGTGRFFFDDRPAGTAALKLLERANVGYYTAFAVGHVNPGLAVSNLTAPPPFDGELVRVRVNIN